jgi:hypothetical protein
MELHEKLQAKLKGSAEERKRREEILEGILRTAKEGGPEAVMAPLKNRLLQMKVALDERLHFLRKPTIRQHD